MANNKKAPGGGTLGASVGTPVGALDLRPHYSGSSASRQAPIRMVEVSGDG